ncbi:SSI family serine proteinase inhibitor [Actinosynnema sp. CS-041913]|uniref:SSI family serine proteinase inhibitor n=1 Tax=Actinosynnema sp. CS-041913 TaxID=3239917 RepID=UPI003D946A20
MAPLPLLAAIAALMPVFGVPDSTFELSVTRGEVVQAIALVCEPAGGDHPKAEQACAALSTVDGEISRLTEDNVACTMEYDPVTVTATGLWHGEIRGFTAQYSNPCVMRAATGPVFDF